MSAPTDTELLDFMEKRIIEMRTLVLKGKLVHRVWAKEFMGQRGSDGATLREALIEAMPRVAAARLKS